MKSWPLYGWLALAAIAMTCLLTWVVIQNRGTIEWNTQRIDSLIEQRTGDRWTATDARNWRQSLREANPNLVVPEPMELPK